MTNIRYNDDLYCPIGLNFGYEYGLDENCSECDHEMCVLCKDCQISFFDISKHVPYGLIDYNGPYSEDIDYFSYLRNKLISKNIDALLLKMQIKDIAIG